jgi:hypothetical protein
MTAPSASAAFAEQRRQRLLVEAQQHRLLRGGRRRRYDLLSRLWPAAGYAQHHGRDKSQPLRTRQLT